MTTYLERASSVEFLPLKRFWRSVNVGRKWTGGWTKEKQKASVKKWRLNNPEKYKAAKKKDAAKNQAKRIKKHYVARAAYVNSIKQQSGCRDCKITNPVVLQFHHRDPQNKEAAVATMLMCSLDRLQREIDKCDVICANCHIIEHERLRNVAA